MPQDRATAPAKSGAPAGNDAPGATRAADQAGIERLIDTLVPALVAKLGALNVGELEVRQDGWRIRLQRPPGDGPQYGRRAADRAGQRVHPGNEGLGAPAATRTTTAHPAGGHPGDSANGSGGPSLAAVGPGGQVDPAGTAPSRGQTGAGRAAARGPIATSPAVGVFQPGSKAVAGTRIRAGDRLGVVDMLGIPQDVLAPADGMVVGVIVEAGTAVEYGQELVDIETAGAVKAR